MRSSLDVCYQAVTCWTLDGIPNWTPDWSQSSCQSLPFHQQNIAEISQLSLCTCQRNLYREREREKKIVLVWKFSDLTFVCWFFVLYMELNPGPKNNMYVSINTSGIVTKWNSFKHIGWKPANNCLKWKENSPFFCPSSSTVLRPKKRWFSCMFTCQLRNVGSMYKHVRVYRYCI